MIGHLLRSSSFAYKFLAFQGGKQVNSRHFRKFSQVTAAMVKALREKTGAPMMECKKALSAAEVNGDLELAIEWLRKQGVASASKKAGRIAQEGLVSVVLSPDRKSGAVVQVSSETDFVARNELFQELVRDIARITLLNGCANRDSLLQASLPERGETVEEALIQATSTIRENIVLGDMKYLNVNNGVIGQYIHNKRDELLGTKGCLVALETSEALDSRKTESLALFADELAMHIIGAQPRFLTALSEQFVENEREIEAERIRKKMLENQKEDNIVEESVLANRINKNVDKQMKRLAQELVLLQQQFLGANTSKGETVEKAIKGFSTSIGMKLTVTSAVYIQIGEGKVELE